MNELYSFFDTLMIALVKLVKQAALLSGKQGRFSWQISRLIGTKADEP